MEKTTTEKRKSLRVMLQGPGCSIAPSCNDGIQARLVEWLGFPLVHISGSGQHRALGFADAGLLSLTEMINRAREIVDAVQLPIVSDAETGYGNAVNVTRAVREFERAGVAAIHIEDQMTPKRAGHEGFDVGLVSKAEFVAKIKAALDTRRDESLVIIARSEAKDSLQERLDRVGACCEAGADAVWLSARAEDEIKAFAKLGKPLIGAPADDDRSLRRTRWPGRLHPDCVASCRAARHATMLGRAKAKRHGGALFSGDPGDRRHAQMVHQSGQQRA
jgi:2-methylisocitrate lyase-like PEP mutase family enzyme